MTDILVPISPGELLDRITLLRIKAARMTDPVKLANVRLELELLERTWAATPRASLDLAADIGALQAVNERLWDIEDGIREKERVQDFGPGFVEMARSVYFENDERAAIKKRINSKLGSRIVEEKSYEDYRTS